MTIAITSLLQLSGRESEQVTRIIESTLVCTEELRFSVSELSGLCHCLKTHHSFILRHKKSPQIYKNAIKLTVTLFKCCAFFKIMDIP